MLSGTPFTNECSFARIRMNIRSPPETTPMPQPSHDSDYLGRLQDYFAEHRSLPSFSHMARLLGLRSVASAHAVMHKRDVRAAIGWAGIIWLTPILGTLLYVVFGVNRSIFDVSFTR